jgi:hypothetical protein
MDFNNITSDTSCDCLNGANIDLKISSLENRKTKTRYERFQTLWEQGRRNGSDCSKICNLKGLSMNLFNGNNLNEIMKTYRTTFHLNPDMKVSYYAKFRLYEGSGIVKHTPTRNNDSHYNFFKSDSFQFEQIECEVNPID